MSRSEPVWPFRSPALPRLVGVLAAAVALPTGVHGEGLVTPPRLEAGTPGLVVTIGIWTLASPSFDGSDELAFGVKPLLYIRRADAPERVRLPGDNGGVALFATDSFRIGPSLKYIRERDASNNQALRGLGNVDWAVEAGAFAEYWPNDLLRTRVELRRGFHGHEGLVADLSADLVLRPSPSWMFTAGPRLSLADEEYMSTYFSVAPAQTVTSGLSAFDAKGGIKSVGLGTSLTYKWTEQIATTAYVDYERLLGDAADSPIVVDRGSADQVTVGLGISYSFSVDAPSWRLFPGR